MRGDDVLGAAPHKITARINGSAAEAAIGALRPKAADKVGCAAKEPRSPNESIGSMVESAA